MKFKKLHKNLLFFSLLIFCLSFNGIHRFFILNNSQEDLVEYPASSDITVGNYTIPGISFSIPLSQVIKVGILNDMGEISGDHSWNGAYLAAKEINEAGGLLINSTIYYIGLVAEDTDETDPSLDVSKGVSAANRMIKYHEPHFITGGFRPESVLAYQEVIMDAHIPFLSTGVSLDQFCQNVYTDYARYKYFFRVMPLNSTAFGTELIYFYSYLADYLNTTYGVNSIKFAILREDLTWTDPFAAALQMYLPIINPIFTFASEIAYPITASATDMTTYLVSLQSDGAQLVIPLISGQTGILMSMVYDMLKPNYLLAGINVFAEHGSYWYDTSGSCNYEVVIQGIYNVSKTPLTRSFWRSYINEYGEEPVYTGAGTYDSVKMLAQVVLNTQSFNPEAIVTELEKINASNPFTGVSNYIAFTETHDLVEGWPYGTILACQWFNANKTVISTGNLIYPETIPTGVLKLPPWGIQNFGPSRLPADFTLLSTADEPDTDGSFNLTWSSSTGADNYSIYMSNRRITYPNDDLTLIADQSAISPYNISNLKTEIYHFVVVAYNESGFKMSNDIRITVLLPAPGNFSLTTDAVPLDTDGTYNLIWTISEGADNYSVYSYTKFITKINGSTTLLADQNGISPYLVSNQKTGKYFYVIVAYNGTGQTLSNCIQVTVQRPAPGPFTLSTNAGNPDTNGIFDLTWTSSSGANNYSIYSFNRQITDINDSLYLLAEQNATSPFPVSVSANGKYYYVTVAYNETGETLSNSLEINVEFPSPGDFILTSDANDPDRNGIFYLSWTDSDGAENYSIYYYTSVITEINGSIINLAYQNAESPFLVTQLLDGEFYYVVVAYNETGTTMSNNVHITIKITEPGDKVVIRGYNLFWLLSILSIVCLFTIKKKLKNS